MKKVLIVICLLFLFLTIFELSLTYGVFETKVEGDKDLNVAKWTILVNDNDITGENHTFYVDDVTYTNNEGVNTDKFAPGVSGEFILIIDPSNTEVAFEYEIAFDLNSNKYEQIKVDSIEGVNGTVLNLENGIYSKVITLSDIENEKKDMVKVNFSWVDDEKYNESDSQLGLDENSTFEIPVNIRFSQYVGN